MTSHYVHDPGTPIYYWTIRRLKDENYYIPEWTLRPSHREALLQAFSNRHSWSPGLYLIWCAQLNCGRIFTVDDYGHHN